MKLKTSELTGPALNWVVAECVNEGGDPEDMFYMTDILSGYFSPSTDWAQGGPIIERERITLMYCEGEFIAGTNPECFENKVFMYHKQYGPTHLIAACRCYVASKLGDEVEVPDELA